jgi:hypothetical protein
MHWLRLDRVHDPVHNTPVGSDAQAPAARRRPAHVLPALPSARLRAPALALQSLLSSGSFKKLPGKDVIPYEELVKLRIEDGIDASAKVRASLPACLRLRAPSGASTGDGSHHPARREPPHRPARRPLTAVAPGTASRRRRRRWALQEQYLSAAEFSTALGMDSAAFEGLPKWKQLDLKKKARLF